MPPLVRRSPTSSIPTLLSLTKLVQLVPRSAQQWSSFGASAPPIEPEDPPDSPKFWWKLGLSVVLVLAGGVFAGLTLALMGSDDLNLRVLSTSSCNPKERKAANKVLRLLAKGRHWVLVVLLLGNVIVNESLPIFLDDVLGGGLSAVIVSTTMIVIFGEIIPQAICVRYGLSIGGVCAPVVWALMILFAPIAWPIAKLLDHILGKDEGHTYKKAELKSFLQFHREGEEPLRDDEIVILNSVLSLNDKHAKEIMTPIEDCLILPSNKILNHDTIDEILMSGFSRIPIHEPGQKDNFIGMLLVKKLISYNPDDEWPVSKFPLLPLPEAKPEINCFQALDYFQTGRAHLLLISDTPGQRGGALGIVSLEDLIEEIIGEEIVDETDRYQDNHSKKAVKRSGTAAVMRGIIERRRVLNAFSRAPSRSDPQTPVGLSGPDGKGANSTNGILVQVSEGSLIAETVDLSNDGATAAADPSRRLVISAAEPMSPIQEISTSPDIMYEAIQNGNGENGIQEGNKDDKDDKRNALDREAKNGSNVEVEAYPDHESFETSCKALVNKYRLTKEGEVGPGRTNKGWEWKEHKFVPHQGYLYRRIVRYVPSTLVNYPLGQTELDQSANQTNDDEEDLEDAEDSALLPQQQDVSRSTRVKIEIEQYIVYSKTYRVPMYCFRAWDEAGAPLSISLLLKLNILRPSSPPQLLGFGDFGTALDTLMLPPENLPGEDTSPFPLVQSTEHPTTGELVFSVHPCRIGGAVEEILKTEGLGKGAQASLEWLEVWMAMTSRIADLTYA
ncbi:hemolysin [Cryptococcus neoformans Ze90-1]|nr:hemolysin [Cryptococcus neoformans var. grubii Ze90-1]